MDLSYFVVIKALLLCVAFQVFRTGPERPLRMQCTSSVGDKPQHIVTQLDTVGAFTCFRKVLEL